MLVDNNDQQSVDNDDQRTEVEQALQNGLADLQDEVVGPYADLVKREILAVLADAGITYADVVEVTVKPPDEIVPSQNSRCFWVYCPLVGHVKVCVPVG